MEFSNLLKRRINAEVADKATQYSLHTGDEIFNLIISEISEATKSIYIAAAWFTDQDLFDAIQKKLENSQSLDVQIILDANKDNFYLPFKRLADKGAKVKLVNKSEARGRMHNKFCIIDARKLISGSYNWSKNARTNNDENIIYTENEKTVSEFLEKFNELLLESVTFDPANLNEIENEDEMAEPAKVAENNISDYEKLITELIYAQVHSYDDEQLHKLGKERSKNCAGDAENLKQELDNVYSSFLRDIKISDDKKELIKASLCEQLERSKGNIDLKAQTDIALLEKSNVLTKTEIESEVTKIKAEIILSETEVENLKNNEVRNIEKHINEADQNIDEIKNDHYRPKIPYYTFVPNLLFLIFVTIYSIIFYSSAAYILIFSQDDAKEAQLNSTIVSNPEIFDGDAIFKAMDRGIVSFLFIVLVPVFILGLIFVINKVENKWLRYTSLFAVIVFIDGFTAYKVAESIHRINYIKGQTDVVWNFHMVWTNTDFYLVFVFGLLALLTFEFLLSHIFKVLDARNQDINYHKSKLLIKNENKRIQSFKEKLAEVNKSINVNIATINNKKASIDSLEKKVLINEGEVEQKKHNILNSCEHQKSVFENITNINLTKIENENFIFSTIYVHDRISIFMRGWKDFLHEYFAVNIALTKSREADIQIEQWKLNNLKSLARNNI
jgi:hypothetical protein